jgi:hypothetical protein
MNREMILGQIHPDMACAIALGILEDCRIIVNLEAITVHDGQMRPLGTTRNWLSDSDPLDVVTREYLLSRRQASMTDPLPRQGSWAAASSQKTREESLERAKRARDRGNSLLAERGVLAYARRSGLKLIGVD